MRAPDLAPRPDGGPKDGRRHALGWAVAALGALEVAVLAGMAHLPGAAATPSPALLLWGAATLLWVGAALIQGGAGGGLGRAGVWVVGLGARAILLPLEPHFSEDLYRYLWDGWVQVAGSNPYLHPPADPGSVPVPAWVGRINHPDVTTIYPPGAQLVFHALALLAPRVPIFKAAWLAADLGVAVLVDRLASSRPRADPPGGGGLRPRRWRSGPAPVALLLYLWAPLLLVEVAWSGHLEPLGLLPMVAAVVWAGEGRRRNRGSPAGGRGPDGGGRRWRPGGGAAASALGLGASVKFAPLVGLPALWRRYGALALLALAVPALLHLPYLDAGARLFEGAAVYAERWRFNPGLFAALEAGLGPGWPPRAAAAALVGGLLVLAVQRGWSLQATLLHVIGAALLLSPTLHPWYALWVLPLAAVRRDLAWLALTAAVPLAYWGRDAYLATGAWPHPAWLTAAVHGPVLVLLAARAVRKLRSAGDA